MGPSTAARTGLQFQIICNTIRIYLGLGQVKTLFGARGPSAAARGSSSVARTGYGVELRGQDRLGGRALCPHGQLYPCPTITTYLGLGQVKTLAGPSAAARTGQGAERLGQDRLGGWALGHMVSYILFLHLDPCTKLIGEGTGESKNRSLGNYQILY